VQKDDYQLLYSMESLCIGIDHLVPNEAYKHAQAKVSFYSAAKTDVRFFTLLPALNCLHCGCLLADNFLK
jgi:hypothetical protein